MNMKERMELETQVVRSMIRGMAGRKKDFELTPMLVVDSGKARIVVALNVDRDVKKMIMEAVSEMRPVSLV